MGLTATLWEQRALSCPAGVALSAAEPVRTGEETVVPLFAEHVQLLSPASKPAFFALLTSAADAWPAAVTERASAAVTAPAQNFVRLPNRLCTGSTEASGGGVGTLTYKLVQTN
ncbi:hypothetical protein GCM10010220_09770 [Streptomyces parvulus]|nr:hypothetical protein GCM10010220_09770 [Streptomyces parvulus]